MDKEDYIQVLLSALRKPQWKRSSSVTDWDLKTALWKAGSLATPEQMAALLCEMRKRGLITGQESRRDARGVAMWGVRITPSGEEWLLDRDQAAAMALPCSTPDSPWPDGARLDSLAKDSVPFDPQQA